MRVTGWVLLLCCIPGVARAEELCFRSAHEAALQAGVRDGEGFRLDGVRLDRAQGSRWARVVSCLHPERPGVVVKVAANGSTGKVAGPAAANESGLAERPEAAKPALVTAGGLVRVVRVEATSRLEMAGVCQAGGAAGDHVRVRIGLPGEERFVSAVVRGEGLVEWEEAR